MQEPVAGETWLYITRCIGFLKGNSQVVCFSLLVNISRQRNLPPREVFLLTSILVAKPVLVNAAADVVECHANSQTQILYTHKEAGK